MFKLKQWLIYLVCSLVIMNTEGLFVNITFVRNAVAKGAVCLDGSPPAYHLDRGSGTGINSWLIQLEVLLCFLLLCSVVVLALA
jgi:hypothetical protein